MDVACLVTLGHDHLLGHVLQPCAIVPDARAVRVLDRPCRAHSALTPRHFEQVAHSKPHRLRCCSPACRIGYHSQHVELHICHVMHFLPTFCVSACYVPRHTGHRPRILATVHALHRGQVGPGEHVHVASLHIRGIPPFWAQMAHQRCQRLLSCGPVTCQPSLMWPAATQEHAPNLIALILTNTNRT